MLRVVSIKPKSSSGSQTPVTEISTCSIEVEDRYYITLNSTNTASNAYMKHTPWIVTRISSILAHESTP